MQWNNGLREHPFVKEGLKEMEEKAKSTGGEAPRFRLENFLGRVEDEKEVSSVVATLLPRSITSLPPTDTHLL